MWRLIDYFPSVLCIEDLRDQEGKTLGSSEEKSAKDAEDAGPWMAENPPKTTAAAEASTSSIGNTRRARMQVPLCRHP